MDFIKNPINQRWKIGISPTKEFYSSSSFHSRFKSLIISFVKRPWAINCSVSFLVDGFVGIDVAKLSNDCVVMSDFFVVVTLLLLPCCHRLNFDWNFKEDFLTFNWTNLTSETPNKTALEFFLPSPLSGNLSTTRAEVVVKQKEWFPTKTRVHLLKLRAKVHENCPFSICPMEEKPSLCYMGHLKA